MNLDDFRRLMDGPNYDPARYAPKHNQDKQAQEAEPAPKAEAQPQLSSSPKNPEEYLEEIANKYWGVEKELPPFFGLFPGELHESWNKYKQKNDPFHLHALYYSVAMKEEKNVGPIVEAAKKAMVEILENKFRWESFPKTDTAELGPGRHQLSDEKVVFADGRKKSIGTVRVLAKGFEDRRGRLLVEAGVLFMGKNT
jgi:hypothetical protein